MWLCHVFTACTHTRCTWPAAVTCAACCSCKPGSSCTDGSLQQQLGGRFTAANVLGHVRDGGSPKLAGSMGHCISCYETHQSQNARVCLLSCFCSSLVFLPRSVTSQSAWGTCGAHYVFLNRSGAIPAQRGCVVTNRRCQIAGVRPAELLAGRQPDRSRSPSNCQGWGLLRDLEMTLAPPEFEKLKLFPHVWVSRLGMLSDVSGGREIAGKRTSVCASLCNHEMRA